MADVKVKDEDVQEAQEEVVPETPAPVAEEVEEPQEAKEKLPAGDVQHKPGVVWHLNRDPNDPRNFAPTPTLPTF